MNQWQAAARDRLLNLGMRPATLVVSSHPFGILEDNQTGLQFGTRLPEGIEYEVCMAMKHFLST